MQEFRIHRRLIDEIAKRAYQTIQDPIQAKRLRQFMPQWNLPEELEFNPHQQQPKNPDWAAKFLWTEAFFERRQQSAQIIAACLKACQNPETQWFFDPFKVKEAPLSDIETIMKQMPYSGHGRDTGTVAQHYYDNAAKLCKEFGGNPVNLIQYNTVEQARENINGFWGFGNGIANLYILYLLERKIASPRDPRNALLKIDIHKARIPLNVEAVTTKSPLLRRSSLEKPLEKEYWQACKIYKIPPEVLDGALWTIGSEVCARQDYHQCQLNCPLHDLCKAYTPEDRLTSCFQLYDPKGRRIDPRKNKHQLALFTSNP